MARELHGALESRQRLLRDVSHELRSPLTRLQVAIGLASRQVGPDHLAAFERMELECERLNALIGEVLALARAGNDEPGAHAHRVRSGCDLALPGCRCQVRSAIVWQGRDAAGARSTDPFGNEARVGSAIENVVRNAIAYTPVQTAVSVVASREVDTVCVVVTDAGPGVPEGELTHIFLPFYRVSQARKREDPAARVWGLRLLLRLCSGTAGASRRATSPKVGWVLRCAFQGLSTWWMA